MKMTEQNSGNLRKNTACVNSEAPLGHQLVGGFLPLDFGGVDVMVDAGGNCYVLEINSAPSHTSPYRQQCTAKALDWMVQRGKVRLPLIEARGGYKKFIHPSICETARLV